MNRTIKISLWVVAIIIIATVGYFQIGNKANKDTSTIKIGTSLPLTGEAASYGEGILAAEQLAIKEINDAGGIDGRMLELIAEDDKCDSTGAAAMQKLVAIDKVVAVAGLLCSSSAGSSVSIAQKAGVPVVMIASAPKLTQTGDYIFRNYPSDNFQGKFVAEYMFNTLKKTKVAVIYVKNDWGQGTQEVFVSRFKELGGEIVYLDGVSQSATDFRTTLTKMKTFSPEAIYMPVYPTNAGPALKQISDLGINIPVVGGDSFSGAEVTKIKESNGALYVTVKLASLDDFQNKVKTVIGKTPNQFSSFGYDEVKMIARAIKNADSTDGAKIRNELAKMKFTESISSLNAEFDQNRELKSADYDVFVVKDGKTEKYSQ
ncbi:MAG: Receptor family ligand-binding protein [Patescibacteria group bacterium]|jgi:branched-chain amino acid transport system substrate-binding protein|nr:Receptor family ligand-binding protein [Patescibacteria group bacterium]